MNKVFMTEDGSLVIFKEQPPDSFIAGAWYRVTVMHDSRSWIDYVQVSWPDDDRNRVAIQFYFGYVASDRMDYINGFSYVM